MDLSSFGQVVAIDILLAGDNAVVVGTVAANLPRKQRRIAIVVGIFGAIVLRILFSVGAAKIVQVPSLGFIGGLMLFLVAWNMWKDLQAEEGDPNVKVFSHHSLGAAIGAVMLADVSMSLDNILGVSGAAQGHLDALVFGLILSIGLMAVAASFIASIMNKYRWIGYVGLAFVVFVAARMVWSGGLSLIHLF